MTFTISGTTGVAGVDGSASTPAIQGGDTNTGVFFPAADTAAISTGGTERMRVDSSGNVGIGTTSPSEPLRVQTAATGTAAGSNVVARLQSNATGRDTTLQLSDNVTNSITISQLSGSTIFRQNGVESMRIDSSGNVGIGTTSPGEKLDVGGSSQAIIRAISSSTNNATARMFTDGDAVYFGSQNTSTTGSNVPVVFQISGTERVRIDTSGNALVGTTSVGIGNNLGTTIESSGLNNARITVNHSSGGSSNDSNYMQFGYGGNLIGRIVQASTTSVSYTTTSDYRLKENVRPMTGALEKIAALKPCTYTWKENGEASQGFLAHELQAIVPECVTGKKDAVETYTDKDGNEQTRPAYQGIDTSFLVATLTAAIQELKAEVDSLKTELTALKGA